MTAEDLQKRVDRLESETRVLNIAVQSLITAIGRRDVATFHAALSVMDRGYCAASKPEQRQLLELFSGQ